MTEIDLGADVEFKVKYAGNEYTLREPTVSEIEDFKDAGQAENVVAFLAKLGMPVEVIRKMPISKLKKLVEGLVEGLGQKK